MIQHIYSTINTSTEEQTNVAQNINYMSTKAYNFLRDDLQFALPHPKSLLRWRPIRYVVAGIDPRVIGNLKTLVGEMSEHERICVIIFDEITIKKDLVYNKSKDVIDGFVDKGDGNRELNIADKCCFFMAKAIASNWKYVISYYVAKH